MTELKHIQKRDKPLASGYDVYETLPGHNIEDAIKEAAEFTCSEIKRFFLFHNSTRIFVMPTMLGSDVHAQYDAQAGTPFDEEPKPQSTRLEARVTALETQAESFAKLHTCSFDHSVETDRRVTELERSEKATRDILTQMMEVITKQGDNMKSIAERTGI